MKTGKRHLLKPLINLTGMMDHWCPFLFRSMICILASFLMQSAQAQPGVPFNQQQTCNGSLGDPVVKITFGAGTGFGPALAAGITNMQYVSSACPSDGQYTITSNTSGCFGNNWHTTRDHTGDPNGYFMLINASYQPSDFYVQTVTGLCSGTTYRFSAYVMNMLRIQALFPNITFSIEKTDGTVLQTYQTGDVPITNPPVYTEYGFFFTTPPGVTSVVLRMRNNAPGGDGNDLAIDDISFSPAGPQTSIRITGSSADTIRFCKRAVAFESTVENCFSNTQYQWQVSVNGGTSWTDITGATGSVYATPVLTPGNYTYRLTVAQSGNIGQSFCRVNSNEIVVQSLTGNPVTRDSSVTRCPGGSFTLPWGVVVSAPGVYSDTARSVNGCDSLIRNYRFRIQTVSTQALQERICAGQYYQLPSGIRVNLPGYYIDTARTVVEGCDSLITQLTLDTLPVPVIRAEKSNDVTCQLGRAMLYASGALRYEWRPASSLLNPSGASSVAQPTATTQYVVYGTAENGCVGKDSVTVLVQKSAAGKIFQLPNAFTPNSDGLNDCFGAGFMGQVSGFSFSVYNRWGLLLFTSNNPAECWNGKYKGIEQPPGTYVYKLKGNTICGPVEKKGTVLLIR